MKMQKLDEIDKKLAFYLLFEIITKYYIYNWLFKLFYRLSPSIAKDFSDQRKPLNVKNLTYNQALLLGNTFRDVLFVPVILFVITIILGILLKDFLILLLIIKVMSAFFLSFPIIGTYISIRNIPLAAHIGTVDDKKIVSKKYLYSDIELIIVYLLIIRFLIDIIF